MNNIIGGLVTTPLSFGAINDNINVLKGTTAGKIVSVNDVSPFEHNLKVKLTSDTVKDFSSVEVYQQGKNIMPRVAWGTLSMDGITYVRNDDGTLTISGQKTSANAVVLSLNTIGNTDLSFLKPNKNYRLSLEGVSWYLCLETKEPNGASHWYSYGEAKFGENEIPQRLFISVPKTVTEYLDNIVIKPQIEEGTVATEYVPPIVKTITANADGTVEGFKSLPSMLFKTNNSNVKINVEYNRDINKPKQFEKVYDGIPIESITFNNPYTEVYFILRSQRGYGADMVVTFDSGDKAYPCPMGAEMDQYYYKLYGGMFFAYSMYDSTLLEQPTLFGNATGIVKMEFGFWEDVNPATDTLTIYAR